MTSTARERLSALLADGGGERSFSAARTAPTGDLHLEVRGVGAIKLPVTQAQARQLCAISRPARYGQGERTLLDRTVRDTWEVPRTRVKIDKRRWNRTLAPVVDQLGTELGLPAGSRLRAELHSMLVYAPGQFFLAHQDSEKDDAMVGSLVVSLPSASTGGALEVRQAGATATYHGSRTSLSFVAFYSDCEHRIEPVASGYRVVLTYDLLAPGGTRPLPAATDAELIDELAGCVEEHFGAPDAPGRLVYLLDHQYTPSAASWSRLKGGDSRTAALLEAAAERSGCEVVLGLVDVHETWSAYEPDRPSRWYRHSRYSDWGDEDDDDGDDVSGAGGGEDYELEELIESSVTLHTWVDPTGARESDLGLALADDELCAAIASEDLEPSSSEYEGYMGNWGNTLDRWYHRGAIVLWPRHRAFAVRAEASPTWALDTLLAKLRTGDPAVGRDLAATLEPFWDRVAGPVGTGGFLTKVLRVARLLEEPALASMLLWPFRLEMLGRSHAKAFAALVDAYGVEWAAALVAHWSGARRRYHATGPSTAAWVAALPQLCGALGRSGAAGVAGARLLLADAQGWAHQTLDAARSQPAPSRREQSLADLGLPLAGVLRAAASVDAGDIRDELTGRLSAGGAGLVDCAMAVLRATPPTEWAPTGLRAVAADVRATLGGLLALPPRRDDDWSIEPPAGCACELCARLAAFLADPTCTQLEWPLRQDGRAHVHGRIDAAELPVTHRTRRSGRPYTLVLTKTEALFERERQARSRFGADAAWLDRRPGLAASR